MHSTVKVPLEDLLAELKAKSEQTPSNEGDRQKQRRLDRSSGEDLHFRSDEPFRSDKPPTSKRVARSVALFLLAVLVGVGGTLASQAYRDEITQAFPPLGWLSPVSTVRNAPSVTTADLQEGLKPLGVDLALVRRSVEQLGSNLDQLARKQDQLVQNMATLQAAEQEVSQKVSAPPPPKAVSALPSSSKAAHVPLPPPKSLQPPAE